MRKVFFPLLYVGELILFFCVLLLIIVFNLNNLVNLLYIDMPWEEPVSLSSSFGKALFIVTGLSLIAFFYIRFLTGNSVYKMIKVVFWGSLFAINSISSIFWLSTRHVSTIKKDDHILLILITLFSIILTIQVIFKIRTEIKESKLKERNSFTIPS